VHSGFGTKCIANAYSYNHELIASGNLGFGRSTYLHIVDAVGVVHAVILSIQTPILPVKLLVFKGRSRRSSQRLLRHPRICSPLRSAQKRML